MNPVTTLLLAGLGLMVVAGSRMFFFGKRPLPPFLRPIADTGAVFILLGALIGPPGLDLLGAGFPDQLHPMIVIGLGWIGFLYGSHFEWRLMRRYPIGYYLAAWGQALFTFMLVGGLCWVLLSQWLAPGVGPRERLSAALILGICASGTAPAGIFHLAGRRRNTHRDLNLLRFFSAVDDLPGLVLLGALSAWLALRGFTQPQWAGALAPAGIVAAGFAFSSLMGAGLGLVAHWLFPTGEDIRHNSLILLGVVALGAGSAASLGFSPLFVSALSGAVFANLSPRKESAYGLLAGHEHSLYGVILVLGGMLFRLEGMALAVLVPAYFLIRAAAKIAATPAFCRLLIPRTPFSPFIGTGMLFQGGMALAIAVGFQRANLGALDHQVATAVVLGVIVSDVLGPPLAGLGLGIGFSGEGHDGGRHSGGGRK